MLSRSLHILNTKKPLIMGVINTTPDSFSDGGVNFSVEQSVISMQQMLEEGVDIIDIGGESTRPGAEDVSIDEQIRRVIPSIEAARKYLPENIIISVDTTQTEVAKAAFDAGANWINDISAGEDSMQILSLAAQTKAPVILMHRQGKSTVMQNAPSYNDVVEEVLDYLLGRVQIAFEAGVAREQIILDPGIGFGKTFEHNYQLLNTLDKFVASDYPILLGTSRKRFLQDFLQTQGFDDVDRDALDHATAVTTALGVAQGVRIFRVHNVGINRRAADLAWRIARVRC